MAAIHSARESGQSFNETTGVTQLTTTTIRKKKSKGGSRDPKGARQTAEDIAQHRPPKPQDVIVAVVATLRGNMSVTD